MTKHVEFIDRHHFSNSYIRTAPSKKLSPYIEYFWQTDFDRALQIHPQGFVDILFPNIGYTYLINLGTPFYMGLDGKKTLVKNGGFLSRHQSLAAFHSRGNKVFGIKFFVSPVLFEKKVNFSEYKESIFSLSYLLDSNVFSAVNSALNFDQRVEIVSSYYTNIINRHEGSLKQLDVVIDMLRSYENDNDLSIEGLAKRHGLASRSILRYFNATIGLSPKQTIKIFRIRKAVLNQTREPKTFQPTAFGYYDLSHYHRHLKQFHQCNSKSYFSE